MGNDFTCGNNFNLRPALCQSRCVTCPWPPTLDTTATSTTLSTTVAGYEIRWWSTLFFTCGAASGLLFTPFFFCQIPLLPELTSRNLPCLKISPEIVQIQREVTKKQKKPLNFALWNIQIQKWGFMVQFVLVVVIHLCRDLSSKQINGAEFDKYKNANSHSVTETFNSKSVSHNGVSETVLLCRGVYYCGSAGWLGSI